MSLWLCSRLAFDVYESSDSFGKQQFVVFEEKASHIRDIIGDRQDVLMAHYPGDIYNFWYTDLRPVSGYTFMWPWIADYALDDVIRELDKPQILALIVIEKRMIWGKYDTHTYLNPLIKFLEKNYKQIDKEMFLSPELYSQCFPDEQRPDFHPAQRIILKPYKKTEINRN